MTTLALNPLPPIKYRRYWFQVWRPKAPLTLFQRCLVAHIARASNMGALR